MHPDSTFRADGDLLAQAAAIGFAHIFAATPAGPMVVHAPVTHHGTRLRFHVARANRIADHLDGAALVVSVQGPQAYISPGWYADPRDQVPTWNYVTIEVDGVAHALDEPALLEQLDALAAAHEPRANPPAPWTRDKADPAKIAAMLRAIRGFELTVTATRGTTKLSQNKDAATRAGVIASLIAAGDVDLAARMRG